MISVRFLHVGTVVFCFFGILVSIYFFEGRSRVIVTGDVEQRVGAYEALIRIYGGNNAYADFKENLSADSPNVQHREAHLFGRALYNVLGDKAMGVCDDSFMYGCIHEFVARALAEHGIGYAHVLNMFCLGFGQHAHFCQHGLGHGLVSYFGYSDAMIDHALRICGQLPGNGPIGGCRGGVFMEYNFQTLLETYANVRRVDPQDLETPCSDFFGESYMACVYWMPQWLRRAEYASLDAYHAVQKIGVVCTHVKSEYRDVCFQGIGNAFVFDESVTQQDKKHLCVGLKNMHGSDACSKAMEGRLN